MCDTNEFDIDPQADTCLNNWGWTAEALAELLGTELYAQTKTRIHINGMAVTVHSGKILNVRKTKSLNETQKTQQHIPATKHIAQRMSDRNITQKEIDAAMQTPRLRGGRHTHNGVTVCVGTRRGGQKKVTAWRDSVPT